jgi:glucosamine--fructose-6-phosphate aminotransferase (isomerizing)
MCGIVGYCGNRPATPVLLNGLRRLEYRGYDSAGVALLDAGGLRVRKQEGKVARLAETLGEDEEAGALGNATTGIAHTRWATHGPPTAANAHPHLGGQGHIAVVHNGIIENHSGLRARLEKNGHVFVSETDTEALAHLIAEHYDGDLLAAVLAALREVEGTFGIACVSAREPGLLVAARRGSPLLIGLGEHETLLASDASAIVSHTRQVIYLEDNEVALISAGQVELRTLSNAPVERGTAEISWSSGEAEKGGFEHFMRKEIHEQPEALRNTLRGRLDIGRGTALLSGLDLSPRDLAAVRRVVIVGCGSSLHSGMVGAYALEELAGVPAAVEQAAEFRYRNPILGPDDLVLAISQSGETADTLAATREAREKGAIVAGLVNAVGSTIAREAGRGIYLHAGPEISVASTKAFTCQVTALLMVALKLARGRRLSREDGMTMADALLRLPDFAAAVLEREPDIRRAAARFADTKNAFFIGRGYHHATALEGALKLKEISYIHAEGYHAAELKHGPIALLEPAVPVVAIATRGPGREKTLSNIAECRARSSPVIGLFTDGDDEAAAAVDEAIFLPDCPHAVSVIPASIALQLFAYLVAAARGCSIDQPRNLAKSVTVE